MGNPRKKPKTLDRFVGCFLGLACGDALGAPVEEWSHETIRASLGFVRDFQTTILGRGLVTDDTQMAVLLAESIIQNEHFDPSHFAYMIGDWMRRIDEGEEAGRGVGQSVSLAARRLYKGTFWKRSGEFSAGNSAAARIPPLSLFYCRSDEETLLRAAADSSIPTHIDPLAIAGSQIFAIAIKRLLIADYDTFDPIDFITDLAETAARLNKQVGHVLEDLIPRLKGRQIEEIAFVVPGGPQEIMHFDRSIFLDADIRELVNMGTGRFILQSLPAALFSFLVHPADFESSVICTVNAGGDADTISSMVGALSGAFNGAQSIPIRWLHELEKKDLYIDLSNMLYDLATEGHTTKEFGGWRVME
ncbi:ADP-ribosylglycohydrolase family protein [bacterium]|nr:ADP-ribosylglycohydrolase family protein [bacterium]